MENAGDNIYRHSVSESGNRLNVFDWLADIPTSDLEQPFPIMEVSFNHGSRKSFFKNNTHHTFLKGELVVVEGNSGFDMGAVSLTGELVKWQMRKKHVKEDDENVKRVLRKPNDHDLELYHHSKSIEKETLVRSRVIVCAHKLEMKITEVEIQADGKKMTFFYTADARVDFRELIKIFASEFKAKIEMRQIGERQESAKIGGIGTCGRELCCSAWMSDLQMVNISAARYQNLPFNQAKLSGQCSRLKCCLNFELDTYMDALKNFPDNADKLEFTTGTVTLQKKDILRNLMWYSFSGSNKQYPLTIERVKEILELNAKGEKPDELEAAEIKNHRHLDDSDSKADMGFVNDVGQLTLSSITPKGNKKSQNRKSRDKTNRDNYSQKSTTENGVASASQQQHNASAANRKKQENNHKQQGSFKQNRNAQKGSKNVE